MWNQSSQEPKGSTTLPPPLSAFLLTLSSFWWPVLFWGVYQWPAYLGASGASDLPEGLGFVGDAFIPSWGNRKTIYSHSNPPPCLPSDSGLMKAWSLLTHTPTLHMPLETTSSRGRSSAVVLGMWRRAGGVQGLDPEHLELENWTHKPSLPSPLRHLVQFHSDATL